MGQGGREGGKVGRKELCLLVLSILATGLYIDLVRYTCRPTTLKIVILGKLDMNHRLTLM